MSTGETGSALVRGAVIGFAVVFLIVLATTALFGLSLGYAVVVSFFVALFVGGGIGLLIASRGPTGGAA
jgi:hypothetical protein